MNIDFRMAMYLACMLGDKDVVTSDELGEFADVQPSCARRDLLLTLGQVGVRGVGYAVADVVPPLSRWVCERRVKLDAQAKRVFSASLLVQWLVYGMAEGGPVAEYVGTPELLGRFRALHPPHQNGGTA